MRNPQIARVVLLINPEAYYYEKYNPEYKDRIEIEMLFFANDGRSLYSQFEDFLNREIRYKDEGILSHRSIYGIKSVELSRDRYYYGGLKWCVANGFWKYLNSGDRAEDNPKHPEKRNYPDDFHFEPVDVKKSKLWKLYESRLYPIVEIEYKLNIHRRK